MPLTNTPNLKSDKILDFSNRLEGYLSGKSIEKRFNEQFNESISAKEIFSRYRKKDSSSILFINDYKDILARCLVLIVTTLDPDAIVFGGGVSNEIESLDEIKKTTEKYLSNFNNIKNVNLKTIFLKPKFGDASGVRGAAILSKQNAI